MIPQVKPVSPALGPWPHTAILILCLCVERTSGPLVAGNSVPTRSRRLRQPAGRRPAPRRFKMLSDNCRLTPHCGVDRMAPWWVSPKTNLPSLARPLRAKARKANSINDLPHMISVCFLLLLGQQIFSPTTVGSLPESEEAAIRDAACKYWRSVGGTNVWLLPLVSWDMNPAGRPRPLTNWVRLVGRASPHGSNLLVFQDGGRLPRVALLTNLPPDRIRANRVNAYAVVRGHATVRLNAGAPTVIPLYDFGKMIDPPGQTSTARTAIVTNSSRRVEQRSRTGRE